MAEIRIDLEDGMEPVRLTLDNRDSKRFTEFMAKCQGYKVHLEALEQQNAELQEMNQQLNEFSIESLHLIRNVHLSLASLDIYPKLMSLDFRFGEIGQ
ncbi:hypothetical protein [Halomonas binhaiensis]|uniref:Uncharacterized protein n=1 Tax=Halomonas binhaiensis TaxID=2562282 RepID=A0A856QMM5_9GAMM|nr:hypothetical protein [Halomonas binhaiensis]QEM81166.2 hypothetical protein E4T21_06150 [Halomonas binhaiensis]